jgi:RNA polymerase sigma-70 factor (ECF subfamily)
MPVSQVSARILDILGQERTGNSLQERVTRLFEESREDMYRYLLTLGLHPPQAQEAVQEVFLRLYASLQKGDDIVNPRGWVFRVAHNYGLKIRERQSSEEPFDPAIESRLAARGEDAEHRMLEQEKMLRLHHAVEGLSEQQKRCLFLRMEGLRYPEIGAALGISASTVGEFLRRAMTRLKKVRDA